MMVILCLLFRGTAMPFSTMAVPFCSPTNDGRVPILALPLTLVIICFFIIVIIQI